METNLSIPPERDLSVTLVQLLSNTLVLYQTIPYLPVSALLALGASSKSFEDIVYTTPGVFRYLDLSEVKSAQSAVGSIDHGGEVWRNVQMDENVTEDDFYGGPLRGIFNKLRRRNVLQDVQTLILDGLAVPSDLVAEIITQVSFNVRILSIRDVQHLNERKLQQALLYAIRPSRPEHTRKLQGVYLFGIKDTSRSSPSNKQHTSEIIASNGGVMSSQGAQLGAHWSATSGGALQNTLDNDEQWYDKIGKVIKRSVSPEWAEVIQACQGIVDFDAVTCAGPRHSALEAVKGLRSGWYTDPSYHIQPRVATHALDGCSGCGGAPEGIFMLGHSSIGRFPLMSPPPLHSSTTKAAKTPFGCDKKLLVRCIDCIKSRYCESCHKWWCEDCYEAVNGFNSTHSWDLGNAYAKLEKHVKPGVIRSCFECGFNCTACITKTQLMCKLCGGGYCLIHNEGSTLTTAGRHAIDGCRC